MKITDENFLAQLRQKNPQAIEYIVDKYGGLIKAVLLAGLHDRRDQWEECFNDVLLALWNNAGSFDESKTAQFKGWLCAIARYKAADLLRRESRQPQTVSYEESLAAGCLREESGADIFSEEEESISAELEKLLACLTEADRQLFVRRYVKEETMEEITGATGLSRDAVYARLSRGRKKIRNSFTRARG